MFVQKSVNAAPSNAVLDLRPDPSTGTAYAKVGHLQLVCTKSVGTDAVILARAIRVADGQAAPAAVDLSLTNDYVQLGTAAGQLATYDIGSAFAQGYNQDVYQNNTFSHVLITIVAEGRLSVIGQ